VVKTENTAIGSNYNNILSFHTLNAGYGLNLSLSSNLMTFSVLSTAFITNNMFVTNSLSDPKFVQNTIIGADLANGAVQYNNIDSPTKQKTAKAWVNFNAQAIVQGVGEAPIPEVGLNYGYPFNSAAVGAVTHGAWDNFMNTYAVWTQPGNVLINQWQTIYRNFVVTSAGTYTINCQADNILNLYIDGNLIVQSTTFNGGVQSVNVYLKPGLHTLRFDGYNQSSPATAVPQYGWQIVYGRKHRVSWIYTLIGYVYIDNNNWGANPAGWACTIQNAAGSIIWDTRTFAAAESSNIASNAPYVYGYVTVDGQEADNISITAGSSQGSWFNLNAVGETPYGWNKSVLGCIYFVTSQPLGWMAHPIRITGFSADGYTAYFDILHGNYDTGFVKDQSGISTIAKGNSFSYYSHGIRSCYNIANIKRYNNTQNGFYNINFSTPMSDSFYAAAGNSNDLSGIGTIMVDIESPQTCTIEGAKTSPLQVFDLTNVSLVVFGN
jgi:hypothetical protein